VCVKSKTTRTNTFSFFHSYSLKRGTIADKKHAPVWQAWGVLESRHGAVEIARDLFQQGIWSCAQPSGGQSGGRHCARLWQAWGLLEEGEGDYAAARRCFSRAIDADNRNVAAITAWTSMEERLGNLCDARAIFERALKQFTSPASDDSMALWRAYELMETRVGNLKGAQAIYQRYTRASFADTVRARLISKYVRL
jgi:tetratricopeptide (TPR) repeat protein